MSLFTHPQYIIPRVKKRNTRTVNTISPTPTQIAQLGIGS